MKLDSSAIALAVPVLSRPGTAWGLLGVVAFSFTVPFTRVAVAGLDPLFIGCGRAVVAAGLAAVALSMGRARIPTTRQLMRLVPVSIGVVAGFPILTSLALRDAGAGHSAVVIGVLPAATAVVVVMRTRERPSRRFWVGATLGVATTAVFTLVGHGDLGAAGISDLYLFGAVVLAAIGYAQGGLMSRELGAWQTICWALLLALPVVLVAALIVTEGRLPHATTGQWAAFAYLSAVSMFLGFFAWYRGLAIGPMTTVSQIQLVQPVLTVAWAVLLLGEQLTVSLVIGGAAVIGCAAFTVRSRVVAPSADTTARHEADDPSRAALR
ncbi:DMT family transporter [Gordonia hankookensis]|uniref:DMT family transporter n=1 Tax=Gordonia hankookensis TaxID=589403 RepID=A0ABR7W8X3_9ACTN|nr:DMT family transporter [Gordonia hankookensis]MBD1318976.1 DMT family transporter [Gordonia hankookensis]